MISTSEIQYAWLKFYIIQHGYFTIIDIDFNANFIHFDMVLISFTNKNSKLSSTQACHHYSNENLGQLNACMTVPLYPSALTSWVAVLSSNELVKTQTKVIVGTFMDTSLSLSFSLSFFFLSLSLSLFFLVSFRSDCIELDYKEISYLVPNINTVFYYTM